MWLIMTLGWRTQPFHHLEYWDILIKIKYMYMYINQDVEGRIINRKHFNFSNITGQCQFWLTTMRTAWRCQTRMFLWLGTSSLWQSTPTQPGSSVPPPRTPHTHRMSASQGSRIPEGEQSSPPSHLQITGFLDRIGTKLVSGTINILVLIA